MEREEEWEVWGWTVLLGVDMELEGGEGGGISVGVGSLPDLGCGGMDVIKMGMRRNLRGRGRGRGGNLERYHCKMETGTGNGTVHRQHGIDKVDTHSVAWRVGGHRGLAWHGMA